MTRWIAGAAIVGAAVVIGNSRHEQPQQSSQIPGVSQSELDRDMSDAEQIGESQPRWRPGDDPKVYCAQVERFARSIGVPQDGISCGVDGVDYIRNGRWANGTSRT